MSLVGAVVMAAGAGRRMGYRPKSLLRRDGVPLVERVLRTLLDNGVAPVVVVLGHHATAIEPVLRTVQGTLPDPRALQWALNPAPDEGQGSSLRTGLAALPPDLDAVLVALADQPLLAQADVAAVLAAWAAHPPGIDLLVPDEAQAVVQEIEALGRRAVALPLDVTQSQSFAEFADTLKRTLQTTWQRAQFDALVNNAGAGVHAPFAQTTEAQFDEMVAMHLKGPFFLTQVLLPLMADGGRILNVSSGLARFAMPGYAAYAAVKGAVEVLTRYQAKELGARRIAVNVIAPGAIETEFGGGAVRDNKDLNASIAAQTALGRVGLPDDIGGAVAALLQPGNGWMTGQRVEVSGGMFL